MKPMQDYSNLLKIISVFMIFILLIQLTGCYSYKLISGSDPSLSQTDKYRYTIHTKDMDYPLKNTTISNGTLSGIVVFGYTYNRDAINVYPSANYKIKIDLSDKISIPLDSIAQFKKSKFSIVKTFSIPVIIIISFGIAFIIAIKNWHFTIEPHKPI